MGEVVLVCGPPCAGKTSWVAEHVTDGDQVIDYDTIARQLGSTDDHDHPEDVRRATRMVRTWLEDRAAGHPGRTWVIRSLPDAAERRQVASRIGAGRVVVLDTPAEECLARAKAAGRPDWTTDAVAHWWRRYTPDPETSASDTDAYPPARQGGDPAPRQAAQPTPDPDRGDDMQPDDPTTADADTDPAADDDPDGQAAPTAPPSSADKDWRAEAAKWKAMARKHEAAAKKLADLEDGQKTEAERMAERVKTAEGQRTQLEQENLRLKVALDKGLTVKQASRLVGSTQEELEADADELRETFAGKQADAKSDTKPADGDGDDRAGGDVRRPKEQLRPGAAPNAEPEKSPQELADEVIRRSRGF